MTEIVLAGLRGNRRVRDVCREHQIPEAMHYQWRDSLLESGRDALRRPNVKGQLTSSYGDYLGRRNIEYLVAHEGSLSCQLGEGDNARRDRGVAR
jgi:transposase-like protein